MRTTTRSFGSSARVSHDSSAFYSRFVPASETKDGVIGDRSALVTDIVHCGDARNMAEIPDNTIGLVVTSPPYFVGKEYESDGGIVPDSFAAYVEMLSDVVEECGRVLEPGGRIAINVANIGRKPYRSLSATVTELLEEAGFLVRCEIVWRKGEQANGSCAWGSFKSAANPTLRDTTERIIVASKDRFDRCLTIGQREQLGLPCVDSINADEFCEATIDTWVVPPESATRVGHPAPFPVTLPKRVIELFSYVGDVVLDPFMGSGTTAVAAVQTGRKFVGYDSEPNYVALSKARIAAARSESPARQTNHLPPTALRAVADRESFKKVVAATLKDFGYENVTTNRRGADKPDCQATSPDGSELAVVIAGSFASTDTGMAGSDAQLRAAAAASKLQAPRRRVVIVTTKVPKRLATPAGVDVVDLHDPASIDKLRPIAR